MDASMHVQKDNLKTMPLPHLSMEGGGIIMSVMTVIIYDRRLHEVLSKILSKFLI